MEGSPPRMRGKEVVVDGPRILRGITPAYAGKRAFAAFCSAFAAGSPPRMRGKVIRGLVTRITSGITPAYAGKSVGHKLPHVWGQDHPRVCGEKMLMSKRSAPFSGSPPRMRGKGFLAFSHLWHNRITPAYAGKRMSDGSSAVPLWDHPRVCGEKPAASGRTASSSGSPPRMRGKAARRRRSRRGCRDHPRVCGEKERMIARALAWLGSPPRMRGKVLVEVSGVLGIGITPAYAGKRLKRSRSTVPPVAIVPLFPSVCNKPVVSDGSPAGRDAPLFLPAENAVPASPAYNLRSL